MSAASECRGPWPGPVGGDNFTIHPSERSLLRRRLTIPVFWTMFAPALLAAQSFTCTVPEGSNEGKMLAHYAAPLAFSSLGPGRAMPAGALVIGGDLTWIPSPSGGAASSTGICGFAKSENTGLSPVLPRPRIAIGLGGGVSVEAMYLPPVTVLDATPNMGSVAVAWTRALGREAGALDLTLRAHGTFGHVNGPITCPKKALQQSAPTSPCYGTVPSDDRYEPNVVGAEAALSTTSGGWAWFGGAGYNRISPHLQVGFQGTIGPKDENRVQMSASRVVLFAGGAYAVVRDVDFTAQVYSVPEDVTTGRVGILWRLR